MIPLDTDAVRAKTIRDLERWEAEMAEAAAELDRWHARDLPAQREWVAVEFGPLLAEVRALENRLRDAWGHLDLICAFMALDNLSEGAAWRAAERYRKGEGPAPGEKGAEEDGDGPSGAGVEGDDKGGFEWDGLPESILEGLAMVSERLQRGGADAVRDAQCAYLFVEILAEVEGVAGLPPFAAFLDHVGYGPANGAGSEDREGHAAVRELWGGGAKRSGDRRHAMLFREIAKRLHPDASGTWDDRQRELWAEAQEAYEGRDAEALEVLLARIESGEGGPTNWARASVSSLIARIGAVMGRLAAAHREIGSARRNVFWRFSVTGPKEKHRRRARKELENRLESARFELADAENQLRSYRMMGERPPKAKARKRRAAAPPSDPLQGELFGV